MNWEAIGSVSELLSAMAVMVTLIYLAIQLRQVKRELHTAGFRGVNSLLNETSESISPETARALAKIGKEEALEDWEKLLCDEFFYRLMNSLEVTWQFAISGTMDLSQDEARKALEYYFQRPGLMEWWADNSDAFLGDWRTFVDEYLEKRIT